MDYSFKCFHCNRTIKNRQKIVYVVSGSYKEEGNNQGTCQTKNYKHHHLVYHADCYCEVAGKKHHPFEYHDPCNKK